MPLYFFDCEDNGRVFSDDVGSELNADENAEREATQILFELVRNSQDISKRRIEVKVRDAAGRILYRASIIFKGLRVT